MEETKRPTGAMLAVIPVSILPKTMNPKPYILARVHYFVVRRHSAACDLMPFTTLDTLSPTPRLANTCESSPAFGGSLQAAGSTRAAAAENPVESAVPVVVERQRLLLQSYYWALEYHTLIPFF